jgi:hypothetical protein
MAIDSCKIYVNGLKTKTHHQYDTILEKAIFFNGFSSFQYKTCNQNSYLSYYEATIDGVYIKYLPFYNDGELRIKFNIPKLMAGTNLCSIFMCNTQQLFRKLCFKLRPLMDLENAPHLRFWYVSDVEINADVILTKQQIDSIYTVLKKNKCTDRYKRVEEYDDGAGGQTLYYIPKGTKFHTSDVVIKFYKKIPEMIANIKDFSLNSVYNSTGIINLTPHQSVLRMEIKLKRDEIYKHFKPNVVYSSSGTESRYSKPVGIFEDIFTLDYQVYILSNLIEEFHLNKKITTSKTIRSLIRNCKVLSQNDKKAFWSVVQHENTDSHKKKPANVVKDKCINLILTSGYNHLYADNEVPPISVVDIIKSLPLLQQAEIVLYYKSSIYKDVQLSNLPNPRVYNGILY